MPRSRYLPLALLTAAIAAGSVGAQAEENMPPPASYVGSETCLECHEAEEAMYDGVHMRVEEFEAGGQEVGCEGCHGPGSTHAEETDPELIRRFDAGEATGEEACLSCHQTVHLTGWRASTHALEDVSCLDCHSEHEESAPESTCTSCHAEEVARFRLPSHHPVREGKMSCASCHDVHGNTEAQLRTKMRKNDLCFDCHQDKEGPFIFEHAPVQEDCGLCHDAHGTVANNLLTANEPVVCLQCHEFHFHAGYRSSDDHEVDVGGIERENPFGPDGFNIAFTTNCTQCHSGHHGSDSPSQTVTSGAGLTH